MLLVKGDLSTTHSPHSSDALIAGKTTNPSTQGPLGNVPRSITLIHLAKYPTFSQVEIRPAMKYYTSNNELPGPHTHVSMEISVISLFIKILP